MSNKESSTGSAAPREHRVLQSGQFGVEVLFAPLRAILRPFTRGLIRLGVTYPTLLSILKEAYVESAQEISQESQHNPTQSRLHLLSGVHRKDIRVILEAQKAGKSGDSAVLSRKLSIGARLISTWLADSRFTDKRHEPRPLPYRSMNEREPSFESLVRVVSNDIHPGGILDEWRKTGLATIDDKGLISLSKNALEPKQTIEEKVTVLARTLGAHIAAGMGNIVYQPSPAYERAVAFNDLPLKTVHELDGFARDVCQATLLLINKEAHRRREELRSSGELDTLEPTANFTAGSYISIERNPPESTPDKSTSKKSGRAGLCSLQQAEAEST